MSIASPENQVKFTRQLNEGVRILQVHEQYIANTGAVTRGIARNVIDIAKDNEKNGISIVDLMREN